MIAGRVGPELYIVLDCGAQIWAEEEDVEPL